MTDRLLALHSLHGQSAWLDNLHRGLLEDGALGRLIDRGVRGLTSNPSIFAKAIAGSTAYDGEFVGALERGLSPVEAYWDLVVSDISRAAECFAGLHLDSEGRDGYVSVEVDPALARDAGATLAAARLLLDRIGMANVMIKVPATPEGVVALRGLVAEGRNVNATLIFGLDRHCEVMEAYLAGLEDRMAAGLGVSGIAGVASFFVSRVDSLVDPALDSRRDRNALKLKGTAAINQARLAYRNFTKVFAGPRWERLARAGAQVQRPLWASTSTKNPEYPDTLYVDALIGPDTVNTLPDATLEAFCDHGTLARTVDLDVDRAEREWDALGDAGVDTGLVAARLEEEGLASFQDSFTGLIADLTARAGALR